MKKIHIMGLALVAVSAFFALAVSASAHEWLIDGAAVATLTSVETSGELELSDLKTSLGVAATVLCSGILDGSVGPAGENEVTKVLTLEGVEVSSTPLVAPGLECSNVANCASALVWPVGLPWLTQLELVGTVILDDTTTDVTGGKLGWEVECTTLGVKITDTCTQTLFAPTIENMAAENDVLGILAEENTGACSFGEEKSGDAKGEALTTALEGLSLAVNFV